MEVPSEVPRLPKVWRAPASCLGRWMALLAVPDVERRSPPRPLRLACLREPVVRARQPTASDSAHTALEGRVMRNVTLADFSQSAVTSSPGTRAARSSGAAGVLVDWRSVRLWASRLPQSRQASHPGAGAPRGQARHHLPRRHPRLVGARATRQSGACYWRGFGRGRARYRRRSRRLHLAT